MARILFGAGCFWGVQAYFDQMPGVIKTTVGYSGGHVDQPTYEQVCAHATGHAEVVEIEYDPAAIVKGNSKSRRSADQIAESIESRAASILARHFFRMHDPTQLNRQGPDIGDNYRSVVLYTDDGQLKAIEKVVAELKHVGIFSSPIVTEVTPAGDFWPAEDYHQKYFEKTGVGACHTPFSPTDPKVRL